MSEDILGIIKVDRPRKWSGSSIHEVLIITSHRVLAIRKWVEHKGSAIGVSDIFDGLILSVLDAIKTAQSKKKMAEREKQAKTLEELLKTHRDNFAIANSEIIEVELKGRSAHKWWGKRGIITIKTKKKKYTWSYGSLIPDKKDVKLEDCENMLRPVFEDKLSVKK